MDKDYLHTFQPERISWRVKDRYDPSTRQEEDIKEIKRVFSKPYPQTFSENAKILERYLKFCQLHNVKVIVYIPRFRELFNAFTSPGMRRQTMDLLLNLREIYEFGLLDLSNNPLFLNKHFADWCHLNGAGADLATELLNEYMDKIWK